MYKPAKELCLGRIKNYFQKVVDIHILIWYIIIVNQLRFTRQQTPNGGNTMNYNNYEEDARYELYSDNGFDDTEYQDAYDEMKGADDYE